MIDWLNSELKKDNLNKTIYSLNKIKEQYEVKEICPDGWLVLNWCDDKLWLRFAVLSHYQLDLDNKNIETYCVFHGEGPVDILRECRHAWWGENGYLFYPDGKVIIAGLTALSEFYDQLK